LAGAGCAGLAHTNIRGLCGSTIISF